MKLTQDLTGLHPAVAQSVIRHLQHEDRARHVLGQVDQIRLKKLHDQAAVTGMNTNIGPQQLVVAPDQYQRFRDAYGELFWADPDSSKFVWKHHEDMRVKDVGTRIQSGWTPQSRPFNRR